MIPLASFSAKKLGKRVGKVTTEAQQKSGILNTYLVELFKNHKLIKIFQKENFENLKCEGVNFEEMFISNDETLKFLMFEVIQFRKRKNIGIIWEFHQNIGGYRILGFQKYRKI